ncbi:SET and MYND domain-containing protein 4-like [Dendronephthya gigantea]|uniref:SET and MYND domain-containing protein 4-like n=1 Tax=Dendronephthya gigantea TaxID=151771 RepID=UPI001069316D|nr:SET and MYND domain-containing protein 4-like [Dendronephthya gigantea]
MSAKEMTLGRSMRSEWRKCVSENIKKLTTRFQDIKSDTERLDVCRDILRQHPVFCDIVKRLKSDIKANFSSKCEQVNEFNPFERPKSQQRNENDLPSLTNGKHAKISNGSALIELHCSPTQGRYLESKGLIKAGDVLILERPFAVVPALDNETGHCSHCFEPLPDDFINCISPAMVLPKIKYCTIMCQQEAWQLYHKYECSLGPLLEMLEISSHLALRLLLVTGPQKLLDFIQREKKDGYGGCSEPLCPENIPGCTTDGFYTGDYSCVHSLVTNTERQPTAALVSFALDAALITEVAYDHFYGETPQSPATSPPTDTNGTTPGITEDIMGCLLLHHIQQMPCNIHAVTAIVPVNGRDGVWSKEQRRIAAALYPTASLMNHACDPDVIVSFIGSTLVVRATHIIQPGEEIAHCYGPSASRFTREVRQSLLQKQYFFTCNCSACKSDKDLEERYVYEASFICPKCSSVVAVSGENELNPGKCQNPKCGLMKDFSFEIEVVKNAQKLFGTAMAILEQGQSKKCLEVLNECLKKRQNVLQKYDKNVAETHDALARCHASLGDFRQAAFHCDQSTESVRRRFGAESVEYAHELHKFAQLLFNGRQTNKALTVIETGIRLLSIHYGPKYTDVQELQNMKKTLKTFMRGKT